MGNSINGSYVNVTNSGNHNATPGIKIDKYIDLNYETFDYINKNPFVMNSKLKLNERDFNYKFLLSH